MAAASGDKQIQQILSALDSQAQLLQLLLDEVRAVSSDVDDIYRTIRSHTEKTHSGWEEAMLMREFEGGAGESKH